MDRREAEMKLRGIKPENGSTSKIKHQIGAEVNPNGQMASKKDTTTFLKVGDLEGFERWIIYIRVNGSRVESGEVIGTYPSYHLMVSGGIGIRHDVVEAVSSFMKCRISYWKSSNKIEAQEPAA